jgi:hypothetical protein
MNAKVMGCGPRRQIETLVKVVYLRHCKFMHCSELNRLSKRLTISGGCNIRMYVFRLYYWQNEAKRPNSINGQAKKSGRSSHAGQGNRQRKRSLLTCFR